MFNTNFSQNTLLDSSYKKLTQINRYYYNSVTFDGCYYYFTLICELLIVKMDTNFNIVKVFDTYKKYDKIIYDPVLECFWATRSRGCRYIYKLDSNFIETDDICVTGYSGGGAITGLSYDCLNDKLIVSFAQAILSVNKSTGESETLHTSYDSWITDIICVHPFFLAFTVSHEGEKLLRFKEVDETLELHETTSIPNNFNLEGLTFTTVTENGDDEDVEVTFELLTLYDCDSYLLTRTANFDEICSCNSWANDVTCSKCECDCECCDEICNFIDAIALVETGIAQILNAEGEKIQYAIANSTTLTELVNINNSITATIEKITELELTILDILDKM